MFSFEICFFYLSYVPEHLPNVSRLASIQAHSLHAPFLCLSAIGKQAISEEENLGFTARAGRCLMQPTARCCHGQSCFKAASNSNLTGAWPLLCIQMEGDKIKKASKIALSNPCTVNRHFPLCSSEEISINIPQAQECGGYLPVPTVQLCFHPGAFREHRPWHQPRKEAGKCVMFTGCFLANHPCRRLSSCTATLSRVMSRQLHNCPWMLPC